MNAAMFRSLAVLLSVMCLSAPARAEKLDDALRRCAKESVPTQRLACFDGVVTTLPQLQADRFGMTADIEHARDPAAVPTKDEVLTGTISGLRRGPQGELIFTLDNGQAWAEAQASRNLQFAVGENIQIEHGAMSALWLVADKHRKVRVKRLH
jgi:hypothetical protein